MSHKIIACLFLAFCLPLQAQAAWRTPDPQDLIYIDMESGRIVIEMADELAPAHAERFRTLIREGFYDGIIWHRVISGFMAQSGDPTGTGTGGSDLPDIKAEFTAPKAKRGIAEIGLHLHFRIGFYKGFPIAYQPEHLRAVMALENLDMHMVYCKGVAGMARSANPDSANSQFFVTNAPARNLDGKYTAWGRVLVGQEYIDSIAIGEPPQKPDVIKAMHIAADLPEQEQIKIQVMQTESLAFQDWLKTQQNKNGSLPDICDISVPVEVLE